MYSRAWRACNMTRSACEPAKHADKASARRRWRCSVSTMKNVDCARVFAPIYSKSEGGRAHTHTHTVNFQKAHCIAVAAAAAVTAAAAPVLQETTHAAMRAMRWC